MTNSALITSQGLVVNQYNDIQELGQYLPAEAGSAAAQFRFIAGTLRAYVVTKDERSRDMAEAALAALMHTYFRGQPVPSTNPGDLVTFSPTVYAAAKSPIKSGVVQYDSAYTFTAGVATIPLPAANDVHKVYSAVSLDAVLSFQNPYAPLTVGTRYTVQSYVYVVGVGIRVTLTSAYTGSLRILHSQTIGTLMDVGQVFDAWPDWVSLAPNQLVTSGELFKAAFDAFAQASSVLGGDTWANAAIRVRQQMIYLADFLSLFGGTPYGGGIIPYMSIFGGNPIALTQFRGPAYMGQQTPYLWERQGRVADYTNNVAMLRAAQAAWPGLSGIAKVGPLVPVYHLANEGIIQYGAVGTFDWNGPDHLTQWGGYQYRPITELLVLAEALPAGNAVRNSAIYVATGMLKWLAQDLTWLPMWAPFAETFADYVERSCALDWNPFSTDHVNQMADYVNEGSALAYDETDTAVPMLNPADRYARPLFTVPIVFPDRPPLGPPTDFPQGQAQTNYPDPHMASMIIRSVAKLDTLLRPNGNADGDMIIELRAVMSKAMAVLDVMWVTEGEMAGTFSPDPTNLVWYGEWHGEILFGLIDGYNWARRTGALRPSVSAQILIWLKGMLAWAGDHDQSKPDTMHAPWPFSHNWRTPLIENFEFATSVFTSFSGREQRLSLRTEPRRSVTLTHTLTGDRARSYDAILHARQNELLNLPQWHLSSRTTTDIPAGQTYLLMDELPAGRFQAGDFIAIVQGDDTLYGLIKSVVVEELRINLMLGLSKGIARHAKVMGMDSVLLDPQMSGSRRTSTVIDGVANMQVVPQEDRRTLPVLPAAMTFTVGTDTREVIVRKPNFRDALTAGNTWTYSSTAEYANGPVRVINGEDKGHRTISATWSLLNRDEINAHLGLLRRLNGKRTAAWLPSWTSDFVQTRNSMSTNRIYVLMNDHILLNALSDPAIGLFIRMQDGNDFAVRVSSIIVGTDDVQLIFDRSLPVVVDIAKVRLISLMYRVRQMSDTASLRWITDHVAETTVSFVSVFDDV